LKELKKAFEKCQDISIDYAVMEKAGNVSVIPGDFGWSDLGSWNAVFDLSKKDKNGNVIASNSIVEKTKNSIIIGSSKKLIVVEGLNDFLVADHENAILICRKDNEKEIREFVNRIAKEKGKKFT
jgi:mannose-1-phosphate guanylyltransferase